MSAEIIEETTDFKVDEGETIEELFPENSVEERENVAAEGKVVPEASKYSGSESQEPNLPEKYRGKTAAEIADMHENLEKKLREQGNELGSIRQTLDAISLQQSAPQQPEPEPISEADFFSNPASTVNRAIEEHPSIKQAQEMARKMALTQARQTLESKHPDMEQILADPDFGEWIKDSSSRTARLQRAHVQGDVAEADDLFATWKALNKVSVTAQEVSKKAQKQAVRNANTGAVRGNSDAMHSKRTYRKHEVRKLMREKPEEYEARNDEFTQAFLEGRIR